MTIIGGTVTATSPGPPMSFSVYDPATDQDYAFPNVTQAQYDVAALANHPPPDQRKVDVDLTPGTPNVCNVITLQP